jgi:hypothetical protein
MTDAIQRLIDKSDASEAVKRYFLALDRFDWPTVASLIADNFSLVADAPDVPAIAVPRDEFMRSLIARNAGFTGTIHLNPDHVVSVDGDKAHVSAHMWAAHMVGPKPADGFWGYGFYEIDLIRAESGWQLVGLQLNPVAGEGTDRASEVYARAAERQRLSEHGSASERSKD